MSIQSGSTHQTGQNVFDSEDDCLDPGISAAIKHLLRIFGWQWAHWTPGPTPLVTSYVVPFALYFPPLQQFEFLHFKLNDKVRQVALHSAVHGSKDLWISNICAHQTSQC